MTTMLDAIPAAVAAYIAAAEPTLQTSVVAGWRARAQYNNQGAGTANRVVFELVDGIDILPPIHIGEDIEAVGRELESLGLRFLVSIWGFDLAAASDRSELRHAHRCLQMYTLVRRALNTFAWGVAEVTGLRWNAEVKDTRHGAELLADLTLRIAIRDADPILVTPVRGHANKP